MFTILGWLTGLAGPIASITNKIIDLRAKQAETASATEKAKIDQQIEEAHDRKAVLVAEAGNRIAGAMNATVRLALTIGPAAVIMKLTLWDKVIGSFYGCTAKTIAPFCSVFRTDPLDANLWWIITAVIGFYFLYDIAAKSRK